jgi:ribosomal protein S18 acetylase RimI-like enzyme
MMDAWVEESRARGYTRSTVCTDSQLAWDFYERYGFKRVREFPCSAYYYSLPGENVTGYIYSLDI